MSANVVQAITAVMGEVQAVHKGDRNQAQGYNFRGIDSVVNAVGPALRKHGVVVVPVAEDLTAEHFATRSGAQMRNVTLRIRWRFYGPEGDSIDAVTYGEAADSGDKAVPKAHSVAYRVALLQALCIPTDEPDSDAHSYEREPPIHVERTRRPQTADDPYTLPTNASGLRAKINDARIRLGMSIEEVEADFAESNGGLTIGDAEPPELQAYVGVLNKQSVSA